MVLGLALTLTQTASASEAALPASPGYRLGVGALWLALVHLSFPALRRFFDRYHSQATAFGGGAAITCVFLHLLPELGERNEVLSGHICGVVLIGFVLFYGLKSIHWRQESKQNWLWGQPACITGCCSMASTGTTSTTKGEGAICWPPCPVKPRCRSKTPMRSFRHLDQAFLSLDGRQC